MTESIYWCMAFVYHLYLDSHCLFAGRDFDLGKRVMIFWGLLSQSPMLLQSINIILARVTK